MQNINFPVLPFIEGQEFRVVRSFMERKSPVDGRSLPSIADCGQHEIDLAVASARQAFEDGRWRNLPVVRRKEVMFAIANRIEQQATLFAQMDALSMGKAVSALQEFDIPKSAECFRWFGEAIDKVYDQCAPARPGAVGLIIREPLGVVAAISPWNYPMENIAWKLAPALCAGNSVVLKPAEQSTYSALAFAAIATEAGVPPGVINVVPGKGVHTGKLLASHKEIDAVFFTGSTEVGKNIFRCVAESRIKHIGVECGGKSAFIVTSDCVDLLGAAKTLAKGIFFNQGQTCNAPSRLIISRTIRDRFIEYMIDEAENYRPGNPLDPATRVGALVSTQAMEAVTNFCGNALKEGASLVCGGRRVEPILGGSYFAPTVFNDVNPHSQLATNEVFGPVLAVIAVNGWQEAVTVANDNPYGLAAGVYCGDAQISLEIARLLRAGAVYVNCYGVDDITMPFGGYKQSGNGARDKALAAYDDHCEKKTIVLKHGVSNA